ncbi:xanthine dehydrogenase [Diachasma alloeum]|uniref:xanthine dehydrogenase n=1 Tax=Diachasma alloeum TaxID=454923 RepID=UPI0007384896|nr:xanthine dehydrogenase [Diachasma alloeum]
MGKPQEEGEEEQGLREHLGGDQLSEVRESNTLVFYVNGREIIDNDVDPEWTLLYYLRNKLNLIGTKLGCAEGGCGACTVMLSKFDRQRRKILHLAINACLAPVCSVHGTSITTVEGIGSTRTTLHPIQERLAKAHGSQCGFCTPGIIMSMYALLRSKPKPSMHDLELTFQGNLCRCTGYRPIIEGLRTFTEEWEQSQIAQRTSHSTGSEMRPCAMGEACCKRAFTSEPTEVFNTKEFRPYDPTQEIIFPPQLKLSDVLDKEYLIIRGKEVTWYRPTTLRQLLVLKNQFPNAKIIVGNTEVGVEVKFKHSKYPILIQTRQIPQLGDINIHDSLTIGASVALMELEECLTDLITTTPEYKTRIFRGIIEMLHWFAGKQVRNVAAIGGNVMTGSPISDLVPILMASGTKLNLCSLKNGHRQVPMDQNFFTGYRRNIVRPEEILLSLEIPFTQESQYFVAYKQAKRRDDDIAIVNMALNVIFKSETDEITEAHLAYGGMAPTTRLAVKTCEQMLGKRWNSDMLESTYRSLIEEFPLEDSAPGGMILYRRSLTLSLFFKGFIHITKQLQRDVPGLAPIPKELSSVDGTYRCKSFKSSQYYQIAPDRSDPKDLIGRPIVHTSAFKQTTGEALYCDDIPRIDGELYLALVLSTRPHAKIVRVDASKALALEGVIRFFCAENIPEDRKWVGPIVKDEEVFATKVTSQGQPIGAIIAVNQVTAQKASRLVEVHYEDLTPVIISIEDAIASKSFIAPSPMRIQNGDINQALAESDHILDGEFRIGGQEHFYLETQSVLAVPKEIDDLEITCSTQDPSQLQRLTAQVLGVPLNRVNIRVKRMGGGFGGKETKGKLIAIPAALAAHELQRPVRCMLDRDEDMMITGGRNPFLCKYKVGFTKGGLVKGLKVEFFMNAGHSRDYSPEVMQRAIHHCENAYKFPAIDATGWVCRTNLPSNTAFRAFGGPQGMLVAENIIWDVANFLGLRVDKVSEMNLYKENDVTHYHQKLLRCSLDRCWQQCILQSDYEARRARVEAFNRGNRYRKRGIAVIPTKFGVGYSLGFLNQAGALVHVYTDGSVLITHGGAEMGQGLHTKMIQVASRVLRVHPDKIHISETATDKVPNTTATAASVASDLNGMAVLNACTTIVERIKHITDGSPGGSWEEWISKAYLERISLSATGYYRTPDVGYDFETNSGMPYNYFSYGAACSEVEVDCLTGDHQILRTDIVMDVGDSLNPAIDIGQVEGAFTQGLGLYTLEELMYSPDGTMYTRGPGSYKLPGFNDIPQEFNVSLLRDAPNPRAIYSSKAVGEPPLFLAASVFFAIKNAIQDARRGAKASDIFRLDSPATSARIRTACVDEFVTRFPDVDVDKAWNKVP